MPTNDHYLILVAKNRRLSRHFTVTTPPSGDARAADGRLRAASRWLEKSGFGRLPSSKPESEDEMRRLVAGLDLERHEYLLKTMPGSAPADARTGRFSKVAGADRESIERDCLEIFSRAGEFPAILEVIGGTADRCIGVCMVVDRNHEAAICFFRQAAEAPHLPRQAEGSPTRTRWAPTSTARRSTTRRPSRRRSASSDEPATTVRSPSSFAATRRTRASC